MRTSPPTLFVACAVLALLLLVPAARAQTPTVPDWQARIQHAGDLLQQGRGEEAARYLETACREAEAALGPDHFWVGELLTVLAVANQRLGHYDQAERAMLRGLVIRTRVFGPDHPRVAFAALGLGAVYNKQGRFRDAEPLWQRALGIWEKAPGHEADVAVVLNNLGDLHRATGRAAEGEALHRRSLAILEKLLGPRHPDVANGLSNLALACEDQGKYAEAEALYRRALESVPPSLGPEDPLIGMILHNLAALYSRLGRLVEAEPLYLRARDIKRQALGEDHPDLAVTLSKLAEMYMRMGRYAEAESLSRRALAMFEKALGPEHPHVAKVLADLAEIARVRGQREETEGLLRRVLAIREKAFGADHVEAALALNQLGQFYFEIGKFPEAEQLFGRVLEIDTKVLGAAHPEVAVPLGNLAYIDYALGRYSQAEARIKRAMAIIEAAYGPAHPELAKQIGNLGELYRVMGRYPEAEALQERAIAISAKALGPEHPDVASQINNLGILLGLQGKYAAAESSHRHALAIQEKVKGPASRDVAYVLTNLGALYMELGRFADADASLTRSLRIQQELLGPDHSEVASTVGLLGALRAAEGRYPEALAFFERSIETIRAVLQRSFAYMSEKERLAFLDSVQGQFPAYLSLCFSYRDRIPGLVGKMYDFALWNKGFVVGGVAALRQQVEASGDTEALALLARLTATRTQLATLVRSAPPERTEWRSIVERLESEANSIEKELARRSATFAEQARVAHATWKEVQHSLQPGEAAVEFLSFPFFDGKRFTGARYIALVLTPQSGGPTLVDLGDAEALETRAFSHYASHVRSRAVVHEAAPRGTSFHAALWRPLQAVLAGSRRVYLSPDGKLNQVSWGAVPDDAGRLLIEDLDLRVVSSTRDLLRPSKAGSGSMAVLVGNPDFDLDVPSSDAQTPVQPTAGAGMRSRDAHMRATPLPATGIEVQSLLSSLKTRGWQSEAHTGSRALEGTVKRVRGPRVLHLATHGYFLPDQDRSLTAVAVSNRPSGAEDPMLRSGLLFAGANRALSGKPTPPDHEDGVLTAYEAAGLNLQGTELVVLSACETGLGEVRNGEGVFGLRRAFEVAGAQNVLMSLWAVPDRETQELMGLFYGKWLSGREKHEALREAQLEMRQRVRARHGPDLPFYWAAFVLVGR